MFECLNKNYCREKIINPDINTCEYKGKCIFKGDEIY